MDLYIQKLCAYQLRVKLGQSRLTIVIEDHYSIDHLAVSSGTGRMILKFVRPTLSILNPQ
jgi:hypothetical protein